MYDEIIMYDFVPPKKKSYTSSHGAGILASLTKSRWGGGEEGLKYASNTR
jgi:hypothetical protein